MLGRFVKAPIGMQEIFFDLRLMFLQLKLKIRDPALRQMIWLSRDTGPQKRDLILIKDHELGADILDGVADVIDDDTLEGCAFGFIKMSAGAFNDHFARQLLKILDLWKGFYPHGPTRMVLDNSPCPYYKNGQLETFLTLFFRPLGYKLLQ